MVIALILAAAAPQTSRPAMVVAVARARIIAGQRVDLRNRQRNRRGLIEFQ